MHSSIIRRLTWRRILVALSVRAGRIMRVTGI